jgi:hypothetical protein
MRILSILAFIFCSSFVLITDYGFVDKEHTVHFDGEYRNVGKAKFTTPTVKGTHERYADAHTYLYFSHFVNNDNAISGKVGYSFLKFDWPQNPRFKEDDYHFATSSLAWITTSIHKWRWIVSGAVSVDAQTFDFGESGVYYGLMWGRYNWKPQLGLHVGWYGYTGVKNGYILPILGFDWHPSRKWQLNAIFPVDASLRYHFAEHWSIYLQASAFGRPYRFPIRAHGGIGRYRNGIFEVFSTGIELNLKYYIDNTLSFIVGGGWNLGGWILIKDKHNEHAKYFNYNGAPYAQGKFTCSF